MMKTSEIPEIHAFIVLSTAHVTLDTAVEMDEDGIPRFNRLPGGYFGPALVKSERWPHLQEDLALVMDAALRHGATWIRLDRDGPVLGGLPTYEWE